MQDKKKIFALDIGTRSVVGIILEEADQHYYVADVFVKEHSERAMLDGQIHDVVSVSNVIKEVKEKLEQHHGPLSKVCVAAAGRALKTEKAEVSISIKGKPMMTKQDILHLELSAVQKAQSLAAEKYSAQQSQFYYCVGYSVFQYRLDGEEIGNLIDQQGDEAAVEIIATFLPRVVVESLISALQRANLEMDALTLEPIAAINVLVPASMRRLNVALVDIGAGTSDIAITDLGTVIAYGMVPIAGDEITEAISDQFLLDFPDAEQAKRQLIDNDLIRINDILGFESEITKENMIEQISPAIEKLSKAISEEILLLNNGKAPKAVMLVGGGSQTPDICNRISGNLQLPVNRVAIRGTDAIQSLTISADIPKGPEFITPIGIAIAAQSSPVHYVTAYVNEQPVRLFEVRELTIGDCILGSGIKLSSIHGKPGMGIVVSLNGQQITIPGEHGEPPTIIKNGDPSTLDTLINNGDQITIIQGKDGLPPHIKIKDLLDEIPSKKIFINEKPITVSMIIRKNGDVVSSEEILADGDSIEISFPNNMEELLHTLHMFDILNELKPFRLKVDGKETFFPSQSAKIFINSEEAKLSNHFSHMDCITIERRNPLTVREFAKLKNIKLDYCLHVYFNGENVTISKPLTEVFKSGQLLSPDEYILYGDEIELKFYKIEPFIFQDIFRFVDISMPQNSNGKFELLNNKEAVTFYDTISEGDQLEIIWPSVYK
ncbi:cell division protein FtsA [Heyndrickxia vini]|uniref:Cell division protein FtsA n=1 Tax=Heyndrickxia vini TaxID=1476025 RepID=A0ABX7E4D2_9BACI|nr:cell division protein FtsA [Heyndrickxia vini]QQZ10583.1 cell division protein FtsA [Heyndrickxia vini]